jgi:hypothetical protein
MAADQGLVTMCEAWYGAKRCSGYSNGSPPALTWIKSLKISTAREAPTEPHDHEDDEGQYESMALLGAKQRQGFDLPRHGSTR